MLNAGAKTRDDRMSILRLSRLRRIAKWMGLMACVVTMGTWAANLRWTARLRTKHMCVEVLDGTCWIVHNRPRAWDEPRWSSRRAYSSFRESLGLCLPEVSVGGAYSYAGVPLWSLFTLAAVPTFVLWRRDRRRIGPGHCRRCGYNLTGAEHEKCPECGRACGAN